MDTYVNVMKAIKPVDQAAVEAHVAYLKVLDDNGKLVLAGPYADGDGGLVIYTAASRNEAIITAKADPFVADGYQSFEVRAFLPANRHNDYLVGPVAEPND